MTTITHTITAWRPPAWAAEVEHEDSHILWRRRSPIGVRHLGPDDQLHTLNVGLERFDRVEIDFLAGTVTLDVGPTLVRVGDDLEVTPDELDALTEALTEMSAFCARLWIKDQASR